MLMYESPDVTSCARQLIARYGVHALDIAREYTQPGSTTELRARDRAYLVLNAVERMMDRRGQERSTSVGAARAKA